MVSESRCVTPKHYLTEYAGYCWPCSCCDTPRPHQQADQENNTLLGGAALLTQLLTQLSPGCGSWRHLGPAKCHTLSLAHPVSLFLVLRLRGPETRRLARTSTLSTTPTPTPGVSSQLHPEMGWRLGPSSSNEHPRCVAHQGPPEAQPEAGTRMQAVYLGSDPK